MNEQAMKFRIGVFVLSAAILLAILIILFGRLPTVFLRQFEYQVNFPQAPGVEPGTPVRKSGVKIGEVTAVDLDPQTGRVTVRLAVDPKYQLLQSDQPTLGRGLLGDTTLNFEPKPEPPLREPAPSGFVFQGQVSPDLTGAIRRASDLLPLTEAAIQDVRGAVRAISEAIPEVRRTNAEIQVAAANLGRAAEGVDNFLRGNQDRLARAVDAFVEAAGRTADLLNDENRRNFSAALANVRTASNRLDNLVQETEALLQESRKTVQTVTDRVDSLGKNADSFLTEARTTAKTIGERVESASKQTEALLADSQKAVKQIADRVESVGRNAEALIGETRHTVRLIGERVDSTSRQAEEFLQEGRSVARRVNQSLDRTDEVLQHLQTATKPLAERAPSLMRNLDESSLRINQISFHLSEFTKQLNQPNGTIQKLVTDPALYHNVNQVAAGLSRSLTRLDGILRDLELFADKVARHPELLGVSGAVNPSSGLKR
jgi:phospholipid/cholesterol/gamma-HCH transport system substrate-binding protein